MISLVCLDMAGTTVNDGGVVLDAFRTALSEVDLAPGTAAHDQAVQYAIDTMGQSKIAVFTALFDGDTMRARAANAAFEHAYARTLDGGVRPIEGAVEALVALRESGRKIALTTGFSPETRDAVLDQLGWRPLVDLALSPADAGRGRPYPDMVLTAVLRTETDDVREVAVVGDTVADLLTGSRAGASIVAGVRTGTHQDADFAAVSHTHVLDSVADLPALLDSVVTTDRVLV
jgi:phosphoglycolate phosphatase